MLLGRKEVIVAFGCLPWWCGPELESRGDTHLYVCEWTSTWFGAWLV